MKTPIRFALFISTSVTVAWISPAFATSYSNDVWGTSSASNFIGNMLGNRAGIQDAQTCSTTTSESSATYDWGFLGHTQALICHLKNDLKISGAGSATANVTSNGTTVIVVHAEVSAPSGGVTVGGVNYEAQAKIWGCNKQNDACTSASHFAPMGFIAWTKNGAGVNKGYSELDYSLYHANTNTNNGQYNQGQGYMGIALTWDLSSSLTKQTMTIKQTSTAGSGVHVEVQRTASSGDIAAQYIGGSATQGSRLNVSLNASAKTGQVYSECIGATCTAFTGSSVTNGTAQNTSGDTPSTGCYNYTWVEAAGSTTPGAAGRFRTFTDGSSATCALSAFPSDNLSGTAAMTPSNTLTQLAAMSAPSSI